MMYKIVLIAIISLLLVFTTGCRGCGHQHTETPGIAGPGDDVIIPPVEQPNVPNNPTVSPRPGGDNANDF